MEKRTSLYGCGLIIVNPPYQLDTVLSSSLLPFLSTALASPQAPADFSVQWLNGETVARGGATRTKNDAGSHEDHAALQAESVSQQIQPS